MAKCDSVKGKVKAALREVNRKGYVSVETDEVITRQITAPRIIDLGHGRRVEKPITYARCEGGLYGFYGADRDAQRDSDRYVYIGKANLSAINALRLQGITEDK